jgi:hypothetical protein
MKYTLVLSKAQQELFDKHLPGWRDMFAVDVEVVEPLPPTWPSVWKEQG